MVASSSAGNAGKLTVIMHPFTNTIAMNVGKNPSSRVLAALIALRGNTTLKVTPRINMDLTCLFFEHQINYFSK